MDFTNRLAFLAALSSSFEEEFSGLPTGANPGPQSFGGGGFGFDLATLSTSDIWGTPIGGDQAATGTNYADVLRIDITAGSVQAIGGRWFVTDDTPVFVADPIHLSFSDGHTTTFTPAASTEFWGYLSDVDLTWVEISRPGFGLLYATVDGIVIGAAGGSGHGRAAVDLPWDYDTYASRASVDLPWTNSLHADRDLPWDYEHGRAALDLPWGYAVRAAPDLPWSYTTPARAVLDLPWSSVSHARAALDLPWETLAYQPARAAIDLLWSHEPETAPAPVTPEEVVLRRGGERIALLDLTISGDEDSWLWSFTAEIADPADWARLRRGDSLTVELAGQTFGFLVDAPALRDSGDAFGLSISGRSPTQALETGAAAVTVAPGQTAAQIAGPLCAAAGLVLDWDTVDWPIPGDQLGSQTQAPIAVIEQLAAAVGAVVQSSPDGGTLRVRPRHAIPPWAYAGASPAHTLTEYDHALDLSDDYEHRPGWDSIDILGTEAAATEPGQTEWNWEEEPDGAARLVRLYVVPWREAVSLRQTAAGHAAVVYQGARSAALVETVEIVDGAGRVGKPCHGVTANAWLYEDLGAITVTEAGEIAADVGEDSLLRITYSTRYHEWRVSGDAAEVQLVVEGEESDASALPTSRITVQVGSGTNPADPIVDALLSTPAVKRERGLQELAEQSSARRVLSLEVPLLGALYLPGELIEFGPSTFAPAWRGKITAAQYRVPAEGMPTQYLTVERLA